jgi:hypothetical protein
MKVVVAVSSITSVIMILFLSSFSASNIIPVQGQSLPTCPGGYQRNILGTCEPVSNLQTCPVGYQRSASGFCVPAVGSQTCPVGYQISTSGCIPVTGSSLLNPYGYPTTTANPSAPQTTFNHLQHLHLQAL